MPSLSITGSYLIAKKHEAAADLHGPIFLGSYAATVYAITIFDLIQVNSTSDSSISLIFYLMYLGFMNTDFMFHFIIRSILFALVRFHVGYTQVQNNEAEIV